MKIFQRVITMIVMLLASSAVWAANEGPRAVVENTVNQLIDVLEHRQDNHVISSKDRDAIRQVVEGRFDYQAMARRSLGKPWKTLDDAERLHFTDVFRELLERSYGNRLSEYKGQKVVFADAELKKSKARVKSTVIDGSRETPVEYRLHQTDTGWQVYDIRIEGTSMVRTFYQDFKSTLENGGYPKLLKTLEEKIAKLKAKDES
ncbi:MAG: phospholipid-binding protein MlaC [Mariprofundus sp.]